MITTKLMPRRLFRTSTIIIITAGLMVAQEYTTVPVTLRMLDGTTRSGEYLGGTSRALRVRIGAQQTQDINLDQIAQVVFQQNASAESRARSAPTAVQASIRQVDLRNFSYPFIESFEVPNEMRWVPVSKATIVALRKGNHVFDAAGCRADPRGCPALSIDDIRYGRFSDNPDEDAIVVATYSSGGSATWQYLYFLAMRAGKPEVLALLETGSRSNMGLLDIRMENGDVVLEVNDPLKNMGSCCSAGLIRSRYHWQGAAFQQIGKSVTMDKKTR